MRAFIAIEAPSDIRDALARVRRELERLPVEASWTKPGNLHLTLKFLGEVAEHQLAPIRYAMARSVAGMAPFSLCLDHLGAFPNLRRPRVLWAGFEGDKASAIELQQRLEAHLEEAGMPRETKAFSPHLTLARLKSVAHLHAFSDAVAALQLPPLSFEVQRIMLFRSELSPSGARYTELVVAALGT